ncbi:MAG: methylated-DNA--[protein]-cysteine S-methyltransferase [Saprospirales bacterium]|jgi:methylated-DNA-[protein]-cysteine S-methyltransferase|nr:methylated-DNA--[protein]-cysteine S-methyltransferase [Saprospirales bacterium]MBK8921396.1 methylated-DNA--[protein]-cysteine S-methyltransferase [Saprospirales bacterium]
MLVKTFLSSPFGCFEICGSEFGIRTVHRVRQDGIADDLPAGHPVAVCRQELEAYFAGKRRAFDVALDWSGAPEFHRLVWAELVKIPYGETLAYSDIAQRIGHPKAVRAVGLANRHNPIAIVVPCHRVIGKAGELRGYFYGLDIKMALLRHENPQRFAEQGSLF